MKNLHARKILFTSPLLTCHFWRASQIPLVIISFLTLMSWLSKRPWTRRFKAFLSFISQARSLARWFAFSFTSSPPTNPQSSMALSNVSTLNFHNMKFFPSNFSTTPYCGPITCERSKDHCKVEWNLLKKKLDLQKNIHKWSQEVKEDVWIVNNNGLYVVFPNIGLNTSMWIRWKPKNGHINKRWN